MNSKEELITEIQEKKDDLNFINDIIIELSQEPSVSHFGVVDLLLKSLNEVDLSKININLIYLLGELGKITPLKQKYTRYLYEKFHVSDRWIRREILKTLEKNIEVVKSDDIFIKLLANALKEEYETNNTIALQIIKQLDNISDELFKNLLLALNKNQPDLKQHKNKIVNKFFQDEYFIFKRLNQSENYRILKPRGLRLILQSMVPFIERIENFEILIQNSDWEKAKKSMFLKEIEIIKVLAKKF